MRLVKLHSGNICTCKFANNKSESFVFQKVKCQTITIHLQVRFKNIAREIKESEGSLHISIKLVCMRHLHMQKCCEPLFCCCDERGGFARTIPAMVLAKMLVAGKSDNHKARQKLCSLSKSRKKFGP